MTYFVRNIAKLFLEQPFCWLIILLGLGVTGITALPSSACCYDPPDYDGTSVQGETPLADQPGEVDQNSAAAPERPEEAQICSILQNPPTNRVYHLQPLVLKISY